MTPASGFASPEPASLHMGVIGNCTISALIDSRARIVWGCMPRFDADPVFCSLLGGADGASGSWAFELEDLAETRQRYEPNTAVLVTELWDRHGQGLQVTDFAPRFAARGRFFRPTQIVRRVRALKGTPRIRVHLAPRFEWGSQTPRITSGRMRVM